MAFQLGNGDMGQGFGKLGQGSGIDNSADILAAIADKDPDFRFLADHSGLQWQEFFFEDRNYESDEGNRAHFRKDLTTIFPDVPFEEFIQI
jgi:hypothetical protein